MEYLKCVRCGLQIRPKPGRGQIANCPRCLARGATMSAMVGAPATDATRSAGASRRASQGVLAASVRDLRSQRPVRPAR